MRASGLPLLRFRSSSKYANTRAGMIPRIPPPSMLKIHTLPLSSSCSSPPPPPPATSFSHAAACCIAPPPYSFCTWKHTSRSKNSHSSSASHVTPGILQQLPKTRPPQNPTNTNPPPPPLDFPKNTQILTKPTKVQLIFHTKIAQLWSKWKTVCLHTIYLSPPQVLLLFLFFVLFCFCFFFFCCCFFFYTANVRSAKERYIAYKKKLETVFKILYTRIQTQNEENNGWGYNSTTVCYNSTILAFSYRSTREEEELLLLLEAK